MKHSSFIFYFPDMLHSEFHETLFKAFPHRVLLLLKKQENYNKQPNGNNKKCFSFTNCLERIKNFLSTK